MRLQLKSPRMFKDHRTLCCNNTRCYHSLISVILLLLHLDCTAGLFLHLSPSVRVTLCQANLKCMIDFPCCRFSISVVSQLSLHFSVLTTNPSIHTLSLQGSQVYHSAACILVQFLMLRLMGRTVTTVLSSFIFQMVRCLDVSSWFTLSIIAIVLPVNALCIKIYSLT